MKFKASMFFTYERVMIAPGWLPTVTRSHRLEPSEYPRAPDDVFTLSHRRASETTAHAENRVKRGDFVKALISSAVLAVIFLPAIAWATTVFYFTGTPGSWVSAGQTQTITPSTGFGWDFTASGQAGGEHVSIYLNDFATNPNFQESTWWNIDFSAPAGSALTVGRYTGAQRYPFADAGAPGLDFSGDGRGNNELSGDFEVLEIAFDGNGQLERFAADFIQYGETSLTAYDWGSVRINSDIAVTTTPEPREFDFEFFFTGTQGAWVSQGETQLITPTSGAGWDINLSTNFDNGVSFSMNDFSTNPDFQASTSWSVDFAAPMGERLEQGLYLNATRFPFQDVTAAGLDFSGDGRGNNELSGYFNVLEIDYGDDEILDALAIDFLQYGENNFTEYDWGSIRYNSAVAITSTPILDPEAAVSLPPTFALLMGGMIGIVARLRKVS